MKDAQTTLTTHAIESLKESAINLGRIAPSTEAQNAVGLLERSIRQMQCSQIFKLPDDGVIIPIKGRLCDSITSYCKPFRLPYPDVALEVMRITEWAPDAFSRGVQWSKIVILASEVRTCRTWSFQESLNASDGILVTSVFLSSQGWAPSIYGAIIYPDGQCHIVPMVEHAPECTFEEGQSEMFVEMRSAISLIAALACRNVGIATTKPPEALNKKRLCAGKTPFFSFHTLVIEDDGKAASGHGGTHASPRVHLRRGHIRRIESGSVWVNACVVGDKSRGLVTKDYRVNHVKDRAPQ